jgi:hypothetical protein
VPVSGLNIDHQPEVKTMDHAHAISSLPEAKVAILPCRAHEPGFGEDRVSVPNERGSRPPPVTTEGQPREAYRFDREFHAMPRLTGGISPVALSLAFYRLGFAFGGSAAAANGDRSGRFAERE